MTFDEQHKHNPEDKKKRKEDGKRRKKELIEEAGGKRPRTAWEHASARPRSSKNAQKPQQHRFGKVMEQVPLRNKPRHFTLSIALPGSVVNNCQTRELKTQLVGAIARAATIYNVDEIVVFDDKLSKPSSDRPHADGQKRSEAHEFMARLLQYCECPQYLRRQFFPMHPDLQFAGLLAPIDGPHHVRIDDRSPYREGVVLDKVGPNGGSLVNCGIRNRPVEIQQQIQSGVRCTVQIDPSVYKSTGPAKGQVVAPSAPRETNGTYWGYQVRLANGIKAVFDECPFDGGYDLKVGTSERGDSNIDDRNFSLPKFKHAVIVFGGVAGIEECVDADESMSLPGSQSKKLFDMWVNICPYQGSRTIRTEEAVLIGLAKFSPHVATNDFQAATKLSEEAESKIKQAAKAVLEDDSVSDESSSCS